MTNNFEISFLEDDWPYPLFLISPVDNCILWANDNALQWIKISSSKLIGIKLTEIVLFDESNKDIINRCYRSQAPVIVRDCSLHLNKIDKKLCHLTAFPSGTHVCLSIWPSNSRSLFSHTDAQSVSGLGNLIAHELKNPLAGIKGATQLLKQDVEGSEAHDLIDLISSEIDRIGRLADKIEVLGDPNPVNFTRVNIHEILQSARKVIQSANPGLIITERYDPSLPTIMGDADTLMQAMLNIIKNASEACEAKECASEVILETKYRSGVSKFRDGKGSAQHLPIEISVTDNGLGIPENILDQVFMPFVTSKKEGQGLGLSLVAKIASAHGGIVEFKSEQNKTTFSLLLPDRETL
jgi:two-component system nitrogen regulation sensor histidine kinase GlnL